MAARRRSFSLREKQAAVCVAEGANDEAARRPPGLIVNNIGGQLITEVDLFLGFYCMSDASYYKYVATVVL